MYLLHVQKYQTTVQKNKPRTIAPTWNDEFALPGGSYSVSDIEDYIEHIMKQHETLISTGLITN